MAQVLLQDKIGALSESGGTITLAASRLTIGGQQYSTGPLNVAANLGAANTRYQIYAVLSAGVPVLVISQNENSVGPAGYNSWKLVGSYYSNGLSTVGFGSFVSIDNTPVTGWWDVDINVNVGSLANNPTANSTRIQRDGQHLNLLWQYQSDDQTGATAGSTTAYIFGIENFNYDVNSDTIVIGTAGHSIKGSSRTASGSTQVQGNVLVTRQSTFGFSIELDDGTGFVDSARLPLNSATSYRIGASIFDVAIQQWSNTPIKDL